jgi:hypothetical protein
MSKSLNLLRALLWEAPHSYEKSINLNATEKEKRLYELEVGILKFCSGLELLQNAFQCEKLTNLRNELFKLVQNLPPTERTASHIKFLESKIEYTIACLKGTKSKIRSQQLKELRLYLTVLRQGDITLPQQKIKSYQEDSL